MEELLSVKNKDGVEVLIKSKGKYGVYLENSNGDVISPLVSSITHDCEHDLLFVRDNMSVIGSELVDDMTFNLYYYLDFYGNSVGMAYSDITDGFTTVPIGEKYESDSYSIFKSNFREYVIDKVNKSNEHKLINSKKML